LWSLYICYDFLFQLSLRIFLFFYFIGPCILHKCLTLKGDFWRGRVCQKRATFLLGESGNFHRILMKNYELMTNFAPPVQQCTQNSPSLQWNLLINEFYVFKLFMFTCSIVSRLWQMIYKCSNSSTKITNYKLQVYDCWNSHWNLKANRVNFCS
jgi:hypothetical protein